MIRKEAFPSTYLGKDDFADVPGGVIRVTIEDVEMGELNNDNGQKESKPVMHFRGTSVKPMILNNANWETCEQAYGPESDDWRGHPLELFVDPNVMFGKKRVGGVRCRIPQPSFGERPAGSRGVGRSGPVWPLDEALLNASEAGITRAELIAYLRKLGANSYSPTRDTPLVQQMIADRRAAETPLGDDEPLDGPEAPPAQPNAAESTAGPLSALPEPGPDNVKADDIPF